ncbi:alpha/beta hydrolase [Paenibacillus tuaregi]|uniref:alpha/beta hydrolase n=1 Tax=Paenibacillus tuaregi TaxID=1816681 RepID=UPI000837FD07|nr:alpha/beta hydrolase family protein [Paenibacillus tuaregi]
MAYIQCRFFSEVLGLNTSMSVILPEPGPADSPQQSGPYRVLYLLHGLSDDDTAWVRQTAIERYVAGLGIAVVMPQVFHSFYTNMTNGGMVSGGRFWTFISEEVPRIAQSFFPISAAREDNFVAGLSMGGYGAFKLALSHPERYAAAASLSGALDIRTIKQRMPELYTQLFGDKDITGTGDDLFHLLERTSSTASVKPKLYQACGTEDFLYVENVAFRNALSTSGMDYIYEEGPGEHNWDYWDARIRDVLKWLPMNNK